MASCHECGSFEVYSSKQVLCLECRRNILDELRQAERKTGSTREITLCSHYDPFRSSSCAECWFGIESGVNIEDMPGNTEKSRCGRLVWVTPTTNAVDRLRLVMGVK